MATKIVDIPAIMQVIGNIYLRPSLLDETDKYHFYPEDFTEDFHKVLFGAIYNLYQLGAAEITPITIEDYLEKYPKKLSIYQLNKGSEYLAQLTQNTQTAAFPYYYNRMKKMTLLRMYQSIGMDMRWIYDPDNIFDVKKKQAQEEYIDNVSLDDIADEINKRIDKIRLKYADVTEEGFVQGGEGVDELIERLQKNPEIGAPLYGGIVNTITRGARLSKFYLRSAASGVGKSRQMIADACGLACDEMYDLTTNQWIDINIGEPTLFISTEQKVDEIQTMILAFLSGVNEERIIRGNYLAGELERVKHAAQVLKRSPLYIKELPDFSLEDIENAIKFGVNTWNVKYICYDYIHTSMKILSEISSKAKVSGLREDNVLFMISVRLKDLCNEYDVFVLSSTQLNGAWQDADTYDQNLLRGAKSLADKIDVGMITLNVTEKDIETLRPLCAKTGLPLPNYKMSVYKNRRGRWNNILVWGVADKGICRFNPYFVTDYNYELQNIEETIITYDT